MKKKNVGLMLVLAVAAVAAFTVSNNVEARGVGNPNVPVVVYVTSHELYYDSIITADLPPHGRFQKLEPGTHGGPQTEFGPGDQEYVGGRWWVDANGNGEQDADDVYFLCPLLGPGRPTP